MPELEVNQGKIKFDKLKVSNLGCRMKIIFSQNGRVVHSRESADEFVCDFVGDELMTHKQIETLTIEINHLKERERRCETVSAAETRALFRAVQEIGDIVGLDDNNSPRDIVDAVRNLAAYRQASVVPAAE